MKNKAIIIDKNTIAASSLESLMHRQWPNFEVVAKVKNANEGIALLKKEEPQLIFVNIQHITAAHFIQLKELQAASFSIVFITPQFIEQNLQRFTQENTINSGIELRIENSTEFISLDKIMRVQASSSYCTFYLTDYAKPILISKPLKYYEQQFGKNQFIKPHRSHLINKDCIQSFKNMNGLHLILEDGTSIKVSRRQLSNIKNYLKLNQITPFKGVLKTVNN